MIPGSLVSSAIGRRPLKTTKGGSLRPSAIAARTTVNRPLSGPVDRIGTCLSQVHVTVVSPGMSIHSGVAEGISFDYVVVLCA